MFMKSLGTPDWILFHLKDPTLTNIYALFHPVIICPVIMRTLIMSQKNYNIAKYSARKYILLLKAYNKIFNNLKNV